MEIIKMSNGTKIYKMEEEHIRQAISQYLQFRYGGDAIDPDSVKLVIKVTHCGGAGTGTTIRGIATSKEE